MLFAFLALPLLYLFLVAPSLRRVDARPLMTRDFAHRGLFGPGAPENSLPAFERAVQRGCGIELDVQLSADGALCVFHDETLLRLLGDDRPLAACTLAQLKAYDLGGGARIPTLAEVLRLVDGAVPLLIEIKPHGDTQALCRAVAEQMRAYAGPYCVESFHPMALRCYRALAPGVACGQLSFGNRPEPGRHAARDFLFRHMLLHVLSRPDFLARDLRGGGRFSLWILRRFFRVPMAVWTVRDGSRPEGAEAIIFEEA